MHAHYFGVIGWLVGLPYHGLLVGRRRTTAGDIRGCGRQRIHGLLVFVARAVNVVGTASGHDQYDAADADEVVALMQRRAEAHRSHDQETPEGVEAVQQGARQPRVPAGRHGETAAFGHVNRAKCRRGKGREEEE